MSKNFKTSNSAAEPTSFKSEAEAAKWFDSVAGRRSASQALRRTLKGGSVKLLNGLPSPGELEALALEARASTTKAISLRLPQSDIDTAKRIAEREGIGYQTLLKNIISKGLRRAS